LMVPTLGARGEKAINLRQILPGKPASSAGPFFTS
jgi:hypothetical protein